jgi:hypothetical protein
MSLITDHSDTYESSFELNIAPKDMLKPDILVRITEKARTRSLSQ